MTDPASYRSEAKLTQSVAKSRNSLRKISLIVLALLFGIAVKLTDAGASVYSVTFSDEKNTVLNSFPLVITIPEGTVDGPLETGPHEELHALLGSVTATCNTDTGNCTITPNLSFEGNGLSITGPQSGNYSSGGFAAIWRNPSAPGGDSYIYLTASIIDGVFWDTFHIYAYAQHTAVPEIPAGAAVPLALLLGAGIFYLRRKRCTA